MNPETKIKIRGYHLDVYGHVNNARYLEFLEEARWTLFEGELETWVSMGISFFVVNININYRSPAVLNTTLEIHSSITKFRSRSCVLTQKVFESGTDRVVADADVTFVIVDSSGKAVSINGEVFEHLKQYGDAS